MQDDVVWAAVIGHREGSCKGVEGRFGDRYSLRSAAVFALATQCRTVSGSGTPDGCLVVDGTVLPTGEGVVGGKTTMGGGMGWWRILKGSSHAFP